MIIAFPNLLKYIHRRAEPRHRRRSSNLRIGDDPASCADREEGS